MISAEIASIAVKHAYETGNFTEEFFTKYYKTPWEATIGKELKTHLFVRYFLNSLKGGEIVRFIKENKKIIESVGDMDFPSALARALLKFWNTKFFLKHLPGIIKSLRAFFLF